MEKYDRDHRYGVLSGRNLEDIVANTRALDGQCDKRNCCDFALWKKASPEHIMRWPSPWSDGFPGWHMECSAMSTKYLGERFDIHGGGMDLMFPHHECEIAQSTAALGHDSAKYWVHNNMITINGQKMGKSLGNFITLEELFTGSPMAKNVVQKCGLPVLGYDVVQQQMDAFREAGGIPVSDPAEIYKACDVILQILPTHPIIRNSVEQAIQYGKPGNVIVDLSSTAPDIILELYQQAKDAGMFLLDSPVSGGNPMAIAGTLAIMTGGDKEAFDKVKPVLACMGSPVYTGGPASGSVTKLVNNMIGGAILVAIAEGYAFAAKAGIDLQTTFEATRGGFAGGPMYDNKVPKIIKRDYTPGARIAVHRKDILNAKHYAHKLDIDTPLTDVVLHVMDWMNDNGHIDEDQAALVKYYEDKMGVKVGREETAD